MEANVMKKIILKNTFLNYTIAVFALILHWILITDANALITKSKATAEKTAAVNAAIAQNQSKMNAIQAESQNKIKAIQAKLNKTITQNQSKINILQAELNNALTDSKRIATEKANSEKAATENLLKAKNETTKALKELDDTRKKTKEETAKLNSSITGLKNEITKKKQEKTNLDKLLKAAKKSRQEYEEKIEKEKKAANEKFTSEKKKLRDSLSQKTKQLGTKTTKLKNLARVYANSKDNSSTSEATYLVEIELLKSEVSTLKEDIQSLLQRAKEFETESRKYEQKLLEKSDKERRHFIDIIIKNHENELHTLTEIGNLKTRLDEEKRKQDTIINHAKIREAKLNTKITELVKKIKDDQEKYASVIKFNRESELKNLALIDRINFELREAILVNATLNTKILKMREAKAREDRADSSVEAKRLLQMDSQNTDLKEAEFRNDILFGKLLELTKKNEATALNNEKLVGDYQQKVKTLKNNIKMSNELTKQLTKIYNDRGNWTDGEKIFTENEIETIASQPHIFDEMPEEEEGNAINSIENTHYLNNNTYTSETNGETEEVMNEDNTIIPDSEFEESIAMRKPHIGTIVNREKLSNPDIPTTILHRFNKLAPNKKFERTNYLKHTRQNIGNHHKIVNMKFQNHDFTKKHQDGENIVRTKKVQTTSLTPRNPENLTEGRKKYTGRTHKKSIRKTTNNTINRKNIKNLHDNTNQMAQNNVRSRNFENNETPTSHYDISENISSMGSIGAIEGENTSIKKHRGKLAQFGENRFYGNNIQDDQVNTINPNTTIKNSQTSSKQRGTISKNTANQDPHAEIRYENASQMKNSALPMNLNKLEANGTTFHTNTSGVSTQQAKKLVIGNRRGQSDVTNISTGQHASSVRKHNNGNVGTSYRQNSHTSTINADNEPIMYTENNTFIEPKFQKNSENQANYPNTQPANNSLQPEQIEPENFSQIANVDDKNNNIMTELQKSMKKKSKEEKLIDFAIDATINAILKVTNYDVTKTNASMNLIGSGQELPEKLDALVKVIKEQYNPQVSDKVLLKIAEMTKQKQNFVDESLKHIYGNNGDKLIYWNNASKTD
jgi:hypothetical protein